MATKIHPNASREITEYIKGLDPIGKAICSRLREIILKADSTLVEDWKWGPNYNSNGMVCGFSAFKEHSKLTFFNGSAMNDHKGLFNHCVDNDFSRSIRFTELKDINEKEITALVKESVRVNKEGFKREVKTRKVTLPAELKIALEKNNKASAFFESLANGYRNEFIELVATAKREETRNERVKKVVMLCAEGKRLNDKYKK
jgi:uncharacterized protein YdeI (YjbR/CyaY-like superfamily)